MYEIHHEWGGDLRVSSGGDLALVSGPDFVTQRVCRRLLTNPGDYLWKLDYGGGLAQFVGLPARSADIKAVIVNQLRLEAAVPSTPTPLVTTSVADAANGYVVANITYADPASGRSVTFNVSAG